jgi:hypothetical protein
LVALDKGKEVVVVVVAVALLGLVWVVQGQQD